MVVQRSDDLLSFTHTLAVFVLMSEEKSLYHCPRTVGTPYFVSAPDCPVD